MGEEHRINEIKGVIISRALLKEYGYDGDMPTESGTAFGIALAIALIGQTAMNGLMGMVFTYDNGIMLYPYIMIGSLAIMLVLFKRSLK